MSGGTRDGRCTTPVCGRNIRPPFVLRPLVGQPVGGSMKHVFRASVAFCSCLALAPVTAYAQASISGVVKDSSGAVLPGVTVEAASPALIEKSRSTATDSSGQYQIIQL